MTEQTGSFDALLDQIKRRADKRPSNYANLPYGYRADRLIDDSLVLTYGGMEIGMGINIGVARYYPSYRWELYPDLYTLVKRFVRKHTPELLPPPLEDIDVPF